MQRTCHLSTVSTFYQPHVHLPLPYYQPLTNNITIQVHVITPASAKVHHATPLVFNYSCDKND